ncbi:DUF5675 family protein [Sphingobacterium sp. UDSM-2020]|uniref:DUF5675 family protein n=1 Tax=Sphingobacterium sp. UDSM-2020 TaxID=2795738 RepID=UPI001936DD9E|nr:DUF5675 family protein [Sphingobacterium sp. UDSM-2020]QQD15436.1 hypothetical protein JAZ75_07955 [Sphingobacterium sp. UDSM-2020]
MGNVLVKRIRQGKQSTLSHLYIDGEFVCYVLEDAIRDVKIKGETAIPSGKYSMILNTYGAMNARYKRRFPDFHQGMIEIKEISNYSYVYIHIGNNIGDTSGCILVGNSWELVEGDYELRKSRKAYVSLYKRLIGKMADEVVCFEVSNQMLDSDGVI